MSAPCCRLALQAVGCRASGDPSGAPFTAWAEPCGHNLPSRLRFRAETTLK